MTSDPKIKKHTVQKEIFSERKSLTNNGVTSLSNSLKSLQANLQKKSNLAGIWQKWTKVAGKQIAMNCFPESIHGETLIIGITHPQWAQAIQYNSSQLLASLNAAGFRIKTIKIKKNQSTIPNIKKVNSEHEIWAKHPSRIDIHGIADCQFCKSPSSLGELKLWGRCSLCRQKQLS